MHARIIRMKKTRYFQYFLVISEKPKDKLNKSIVIGIGSQLRSDGLMRGYDSKNRVEKSWQKTICKILGVNSIPKIKNIKVIR